jgi:hypothetical protein
MPKTKNIPYYFVIDSLMRLEPSVRHFFSSYAVYIGPKITFVLRDKKTYPECNGIWIATSAEHHKSLKKELPSMQSISVLSGKENGKTNWQMLPVDSDSFEEEAIRACELVLKGDERIGKIPKPKKKKKK